MKNSGTELQIGAHFNSLFYTPNTMTRIRHVKLKAAPSSECRKQFAVVHLHMHISLEEVA